MHDDNRRQRTLVGLPMIIAGLAALTASAAIPAVLGWSVMGAVALAAGVTTLVIRRRR